MEQNIEKIELRSENVRSILGEIPPFVIRSGITVLTLFLTLIITSSALITFDYTIDTIAIVEEKNNTLLVKVLIPIEKLKTSHIDHTIVLQFSHISSELQNIKSHIHATSSNTYIYKNIKYHVVSISLPTFKKVHFIDKNIVPAKIFVEKRTILNHIIQQLH